MLAPPKDIQSLYYITHKDNVQSILRNGILSRQEIANESLQPKKIHDKKIDAERENKKAPAGKPLGRYASLYFNPRNPMLLRAAEVFGKNSKARADIIILQIRRDVIEIEGAHIAVGNAADPLSYIYPATEGVSKILEKNVWKKINAEYWNNYDDTKRIIMSQLLVPNRVPPEYIERIIVSCKKTRDEMNGLNLSATVIDPHVFFLPHFKKEIAPNISLVKGDMFLSSMQTLTISVNTQGIMGKGLALRTKNQFPDVYVKYQDACRHKMLTGNSPWLYKRERLMDVELADAPERFQNLRSCRWFLLFATKRGWRHDSRIEDIDAGLQWLEHNYEKENVESLAMPALGCGLGGLPWAEVGPLMCRVLSRLKIRSAIYLPHESSVPKEQMEAHFLLGK